MGNKKSKPGEGDGAPAGTKASNQQNNEVDADELVTKKAGGGNKEDEAPDVKDDNQDKPDDAYGYFQQYVNPSALNELVVATLMNRLGRVEKRRSRPARSMRNLFRKVRQQKSVQSCKTPSRRL